MSDLVTCPACNGRGSYARQVLDPVWSEVAAQEVQCELCNGLGKIAIADVETYELADIASYSPYGPDED